jgi:hypothetical protein
MEMRRIRMKQYRAAINRIYREKGSPNLLTASKRALSI